MVEQNKERAINAADKIATKVGEEKTVAALEKLAGLPTLVLNQLIKKL